MNAADRPVPADAEPDDARVCPACNYILRGLPGGRCPECGRDVTAVLRGQAALPWLERERIGRLTAYWRTVWLLTFRPRRFDLARASPGSERDARRFRALTLAHIAAAVMVLDLTVYLFFAAVWNQAINPLGAWYVAARHLSFGIGLVVLTSAPWYAIDGRRVPPEQSLPAALLGFYTSGVLTWSVFLVLPVTLAAAAEEYGVDRKVTGLLLGLTGVFALSFVVLMDFHVGRLAKHVVAKGRTSYWMDVKFSLLFIFAVLFTLIVPNILLYVVVLVRSFS